MKKIAIKNKGGNYSIDIPNNQIIFLDTRYYRTQEGDYEPSVTTYLEAYPKSAQFYEWLKSAGKDADEIRDEAGRKGSNVHELTETGALPFLAVLAAADLRPRPAVGGARTGSGGTPVRSPCRLLRA